MARAALGLTRDYATPMDSPYVDPETRSSLPPYVSLLPQGGLSVDFEKLPDFSSERYMREGQGRYSPERIARICLLHILTVLHQAGLDMEKPIRDLGNDTQRLECLILLGVLRTLSEVDPTPENDVSLGTAYQALGEPSLAMECFKSAYEKNPESYSAFWQMIKT